MSAFIVLVRTANARYRYPAIAHDSVGAHGAAVDRFGICAVTVLPLKRQAAA